MHDLQLHMDEDDWDTLCLARLRYNTGVNKRQWYHALRTLCSYNGSNYHLLHHAAQACDQWLREHPSWVQINTRT